MAKQLWVDKYRPNKVDEYVFRDPAQKKLIESWIADGGIPHLLLAGQAGLGKTSLAKMILKELDVHPSDILEINGSSQTGIDDVRGKITTFISMLPFGEFRYVVIDECDFLSPNSQAALRNITESYSNSARFIFTCNYPHKVIDGIKSRCQVLNFTKLDREQFAQRIVQILVQENVELTADDADIIDTYIIASYPDMRKCINNLQQAITDGKLTEINQSDALSTDDYMLTAISLFRNKKFTDARKEICNNIRQEDYEKIFTFAYQNLDIWASTTAQENKAVVLIRDAMAKAPLCADQEINISAMLIELEDVALESE